MTEPIILYDIPSTTSVNAWSPNTWKVRYALNYKGLAYKTEWVEYPDIAPLCKKIGAPPTEKKADGSDYFSLPVIYDQKTKKIVVDSAQIVKYLDETYPNTPKLFPPGTSAFQAAFLAFFGPAVSFPSLQIVLARTAYALNPPSQAYFRETREKIFGKLEDRNTPQFWEELEKGLGQVKTFLEANGEGKELSFLGENKFTLSDFQVAANLIWLRTVLGEGSEDWKRILAFHGGFPGRFFAQFEEYHAVN